MSETELQKLLDSLGFNRPENPVDIKEVDKRLGDLAYEDGMKWQRVRNESAVLAQFIMLD